MSTGSLIIQFEYEDEDLSLKQIEKKFIRIIKNNMEDYGDIKVEHLEAAPGNLMNAFGIEEV